MSAIQNLSEPWNGHTHKEVEDFVKSELKGGGGAGGTMVEFTLSSDPHCSSSVSITSISMTKQDLHDALLAGPVIAKIKCDGDIIAVLPVFADVMGGIWAACVMYFTEFDTQYRLTYNLGYFE